MADGLNIDWNSVNKEDQKLISSIAKRGKKEIEAITDRIVDGISLNMDITACHISNPLKLKELLEADEFNFVHDIGGIQRHLNRETGKLEQFFLPRYSA